jgi:ribosomal protein S3AE
MRNNNNFIVKVEFLVQADYLVIQDITNELQQVIQNKLEENEFDALTHDMISVTISPEQEEITQ